VDYVAAGEEGYMNEYEVNGAFTEGRRHGKQLKRAVLIIFVDYFQRFVYSKSLILLNSLIMKPETVSSPATTHISLNVKKIIILGDRHEWRYP